MTQGIYKVELAGQMYIGSSLWIEKRFSAHKSDLRYGRHQNAQMQRHYDDGHHITYEVLLECEEEDLTILEQASLDRHKPSLNINLIAKRPTPEARARQSATLMGKRHSPETRAKMSAAATGRMKSPEVRERIGAASRGKPKSPEARAKMSAAHMGKKHSPETRAKLRAAWVRRKARESDR